MGQNNALVNDCVGLLGQGIELLENLDEDLYTRTEGLHSRSGVGVHFRHCIDFVNCLLAGIETGFVDYNQRARDENAERFPSFAIEKMRSAITALESLSNRKSDDPLFVSLEGNQNDSGVYSWCKSTVLRELQFMQSHLTHHYALIALMLRMQGVEPGYEFGVTPSTLTYWRSRKLVTVNESLLTEDTHPLAVSVFSISAA